MKNSSCQARQLQGWHHPLDIVREKQQVIHLRPYQRQHQPC